MIGSVAVLRILQNTPEGEERIRENELMNINAILDQIAPSDDEIERAFQSRLSEEELQNEDIGIVTKDGQLLRARLSKPSGNGPFPVVIIIHSAPSSTRATDEIGTVWGESIAREQNALTFTLDWREGTMGEEEVTDVVSTIDWARKLLQATDQPIYLFGLDHGVYIALRALETHQEYVDGLIAAYGYSDIAAQYAALVAQDSRGAENFLTQTGCSEAVAVDSCLNDLSATTVEISVPTLLLHGRADSVVPFTQAEQIATQVNESVQLTSVFLDDTAVDHFFLDDTNDAGFTAGEQAIADWLSAQ